MGLWDNLGFSSSCPSGQRYSQLLQMCVADDQNGGITTTAAGSVMVSDEKSEKGKFWDKAPDYIDSLANLWGAIKGQPIGAGAGAGVPGYYPPQKDNTGTILTIGILVLLLMLVIVLIIIRRKN